MMTKKCISDNCANLVSAVVEPGKPAIPFCRLYNHPVGETSFCSEFSNQSVICAICGNPVGKTPVFSEEKIICMNCATNRVNTCACCEQAHNCDFETNPSPLPKETIQTIHQGPMIMQTTVRNPERIKITCEQNCTCYDKDQKICGKTQNWCAQYKESF